MSRTALTGPRLPKSLLDQVGDGRITKQRRSQPPRRDWRNGVAQHRGTDRPTKPAPFRKPFKPHLDKGLESDLDDSGDEDEDYGAPSKPAPAAAKLTSASSHLKGSRSILKEVPLDEARSRNDEYEAPVVSRAVKDRLAEDDAEIAALEKKLGIKGKKSKALEDDGLDWLVGESEEDGDGERVSSKRKRPEDERWLREKRLRAQGTAIKKQMRDEDTGTEQDESEGEEEEEEDDDLSDLQNPFSDDELSEGDFEGFGSDLSDRSPKPIKKRERENPYVAPVPKGTETAKYIPPSLRVASSSDEETVKQLRRQLQGLLNRLSEANLLSILQSIEQIYAQNARQYVTSALIDMLLGLVTDPAVLNDTFLILHAGFATALYKIVGTDFGAQLLEGAVHAFDRFRTEKVADGKQMLNLIAFLANLYSLQAIGSEVIFDYIRWLLNEISETNTELLLRVIRISGTQLRQDDPTALKDIVLLLQRSVAKADENKLSVRTKFMIETIQDLKNNRMKTGLSASALVTEHMQRIRKILGSLNNRAKASEPLHITLADIRDTEKKGKWWLVGASYKDPARMASHGNSSIHQHGTPADEDGDESDASDSVNLDRLARAQGMNTDVRRAIFVSIAGAVDYKHAHIRLQKLNLKNKQLIEVPRVLLHCVGAEATYNHYYTVIAREFCGDHKLRKAYQFALLDLFRRMGERGDNGESDDEDEDEDDDLRGQSLSVTKIYNLAKMYATLIADGLLRITILKTLDLSNLQSKTQVFVEVLLMTVLVLLRKNGRDTFEASVKNVFQAAHFVSEMVTGLRYYVSTILANTEITSSKKELKTVAKGCEYATEALAEAPNSAFVPDHGSSSDEEDMF